MKNIKSVSAIKNKVSSIKRSVMTSNEPLFPWISKLINSIYKFIVRLFHIDKIDPKLLAIMLMLLKILFKGSLYANISIAVIVFLSHALDLEYKFTWELFTYLIPAIYITFKTYFTDFGGRLSSLIKGLLEKLSRNLHEVKVTVEKDVEKMTHLIDTDPEPKPESTKWKYFKYGLYAVGGLTILFAGYYYWDDYTKPILTCPFVGVKKVYNFIKSCFGKGKPTPKGRVLGQFEPDYAGSGVDLEMGVSKSVDKNTSGGYLTLFNRSGRSSPNKNITEAKPKETLFSVGEYVDPFSDTPVATTSTAYMDVSSSNNNISNIDKNK